MHQSTALTSLDRVIRLDPPVGPPIPFPPPPATGNGAQMMRIGDTERADSATTLSSAFTLGYLDLQEYETRLEHAYSARHRTELDALTADLPPHRRAPSPCRRSGHQNALLGLRIHAGAAALAVAVCWIVWTIIAVTAGAWYPWPLWPTLGAVAGIVSHAVPVLASTVGPRSAIAFPRDS